MVFPEIILTRVLNDASVPTEIDASTAFGGWGDLLPLRGYPVVIDVREGHVCKGHWSSRELTALVDIVGFQSGVNRSEDFSLSGTGEWRTISRDTGVDGEVRASVLAVGGDRSLEGVSRTETLNWGGIVRSSRRATIPRGK